MLGDALRFRRFRLELDGVVQGAFESLEPPLWETEISLGRGATAMRLHNARLRHGVANTRELFRWFSSVLEGQPQARSGAVVEVDDQGEERFRHEFDDAWPVRIRVADLGPEVESELAEVELVVERWRSLAAKLPA